MSTTLKVPNFEDINILQRSVVAAPGATAGTATLPLLSVENLNVGDVIYLPAAPNTQAEKATVLSISGKTVTTAANLTYDHVAGEIVTKVFGDQLKFYRVAVPQDGSIPADTAFTAIPGGVVSIDPEALESYYTDASGGAMFWYKFTHYNSSNANETSLAACDAVRGGDFGHYTTIEDIRLEAGFENNPNIEDVLIGSYRTRAEAEVNGFLALAYILPLPVVPVMVEYATLKLAAGYLMCKEYGPYQQGESKEGLGKISEARALLKRIAERQTMLADAMENILQVDNAISSWPDDSTAQASRENSGGGHMFRRTDRY